MPKHTFLIPLTDETAMDKRHPTAWLVLEGCCPFHAAIEAIEMMDKAIEGSNHTMYLDEIRPAIHTSLN